MFPAYVPAEWAPTKMTRKQYNDQRAHLEAQLAGAQQVVAGFEEAFSGPAAHQSLSFHESVGTMWNAGHDAVTALEFAIMHLDREWSARKVDPYQRYLVSNNID